MPPPPRPPIICYDLQTNKNPRPQHKCLHPTLALPRRQAQKVTVIHEKPNPSHYAFTPGCWHRPLAFDYETVDATDTNHMLVDDEQAELSPRKRSVRFDPQTTDFNPPTRVRVAPIPPVRSIRPQDYHSESFSFAQPKRLTTNGARHAYGQKLKQEAIERERLNEIRREQAALQEQLADVCRKLELVKQGYENVSKGYGSSHNAAKYIQKRDEECAILHKRVEEITDARSKEIIRREQQAKKMHNMQRAVDLRLEEQRLREIYRHRAQRATLSSTLNQSISNSSSPSTVASSLLSPHTSSMATNRIGSSSTISFSSSSSSTGDSGHLSPPSLHSNEPQTTRTINRPNSRLQLPSALKQDKQLQTSTLISQVQPMSALKNRSNIMPKTSTPNAKKDSLFHSALENFSFYKSDPKEKTLEITDEEFFEKMEDKTMIEINKLFKNVQSELNKYKPESMARTG